MPRVNRATSEQTKERIIETAAHIVLNEGFEHLTFTNIAKEANISRSSTNTHFKNKEDLIEAIKPKVGEVIVPLFCYDSPEKFLESWKKVYLTDPHAQKLLYNTRHLVSSNEGIDGLISLIQGEDREKVEEVVLYCIGYSMYKGIYGQKPEKI